jgi:hypothetical protein
LKNVCGESARQQLSWKVTSLIHYTEKPFALQLQQQQRFFANVEIDFKPISQCFQTFFSVICYLENSISAQRAGKDMATKRKGSEDRPRYISYLLRLWRENDDGDALHQGKVPTWRASLENPRSGALQGFSSLQDLLHFLWSETCAERGADGLSEGTGEGGDARANESSTQ